MFLYENIPIRLFKVLLRLMMRWSLQQETNAAARTDWEGQTLLFSLSIKSFSWQILIKQHVCINTRLTFNYPPHLTTLLKNSEIVRDLLTIKLTFWVRTHKIPSYSLLKIWNNLPLDSKRSAWLGIFRKSLEILSDAYISMCNKPSCYSLKKWI